MFLNKMFCYLLIFTFVIDFCVHFLSLLTYRSVLRIGMPRVFVTCFCNIMKGINCKMGSFENNLIQDMTWQNTSLTIEKRKKIKLCFAWRRHILRHVSWKSFEVFFSVIERQDNVCLQSTSQKRLRRCHYCKTCDLLETTLRYYKCR